MDSVTPASLSMLIFGNGHFHVCGKQAFCELQFQPVRVDSGLLDDVHHLLDKLGMAELPGTHVD